MADGSLTQISQTESFDNPLTFSGFTKELKFWLYLVSWIVKFFVIFKVARIRDARNFKLGEIKFINLARKIHFLLFNLTCIDVFFTGLRGLFHVKYDKILALQILSTFVMFFLLTVDLVEIAWISGHVLYKAGQELEEQKALKDQKIQNEKPSINKVTPAEQKKKTTIESSRPKPKEGEEEKTMDDSTAHPFFKENELNLNEEFRNKRAH